VPRRMTVKAIILVLFGILIVHTVSAEIRVYIDEPSYTLSYFEPVTLAVNVEGLTAQEALRGFKIHLDFDETYLEIADISAFQEGTFLSSVGLHPMVCARGGRRLHHHLFHHGLHARCGWLRHSVHRGP